MKSAAIVLFSIILLGLIGCGQKEEGQTANPNVLTPPRINPPYSPPYAVDYSKTKCDSLDACATACDVEYPATTENMVRTNYCWGDPASTICNAIVAFHYEDYLIDNLSCKTQNVTAVIDPAVISTAPCSSSVSCQQVCRNAFPFVSDQEIERTAAASGTLNSGATLKALVRNQVIREGYASCLEAPSGFILL